MPLLIFFFFIILPVLEIMVFMAVADELGWLRTFLLTLLFSVYGLLLMKHGGYRQPAFAEILQGSRQEVKKSLDAYINSVYIFFAGLFLFIPGFITDVIGILLFIPWTRKLFHWLFLMKMKRNFTGGQANSYEFFRQGFNQEDADESEYTGDPDGIIIDVQPIPPDSSQNADGKQSTSGEDDIIDVDYVVKKP